jgi:hypothetical protein
MRNYSWIIFTVVYAVMTVASVVFMARTLITAKQQIAIIEKAAVERLVPLMAELTELEVFMGLDEPIRSKLDEDFMLGLYEGYIAVFYGADGTKGIKEVTGTPASTLPYEEWVRLALGIRVDNEEELSLFLQDYGS